MFVIQFLFILLIASLIEISSPQNQPTKTSTLSTIVFNSNANKTAGKVRQTSFKTTDYVN